VSLAVIIGANRFSVSFFLGYARAFK